MNLIVKLKDGRSYQVEDVDDFGVMQGVFACLRQNRLSGPPGAMKMITGWNLDTVQHFHIDGEVIVNEVIYDSGATVLYDTAVEKVEV